MEKLLHDELQASVTLDLPSGSYTVEWLNTKTGAIDKQETITHSGGNASLSTPIFSNDIALRLIRKR